MTAEPQSFNILVGRDLAAEGLQGSIARVSLAGQAIRISGDHGTMLEIPLNGVDRIRVGIATARRPGHQLQVWRSGARGPLLFRLGSPWDPYPEVVRAIVSALVVRRGLGAIELGTTAAAAAFNALFFLGLLGAFVFLAIYSYRLGLWPVALAFAALGLLLVKLLLGIAAQRPRALGSLGELEQVLVMPKKGVLMRLARQSEERV